MPKVIVDTNRCKGCALCVRACPKKLMALSTVFNAKGYNPAECIDESKCIGCALCGRACPDVAIEVYK
ncbi:MAG: 4Fe-4S binding protein [Negativicutes bacterium]